MIYSDQSYYKEFRNLLTRLRSGVAHLKSENHQLAEENESLSRELREVRALLADACREADELKEALSKQPPADSSSDAISGMIAHGNNDGVPSVTENKGNSEAAPSLFENLNDNERFTLRQQITELIQKIDLHLEESRNS